jgi:hypothetical protein
MNHGICTLSIVPVRAEPADKAEMVNQLLFGEVFEYFNAKRAGSALKGITMVTKVGSVKNNGHPLILKAMRKQRGLNTSLLIS